MPAPVPGAVLPARPARSDVVVTTGILAAATVTVALVDPNAPGHYPGCPFLAITGWYCPFCGGLRTVHDLSHLDLGAALAQNPLVVLLIPVAAWAWWRWVRRAFDWMPPRRLLVPSRWMSWTALAVLVVFWVLRNLPGWTWLAPS